MPANSLKQALLKNKYLLVRRTLRVTGYRVNETEYQELDESISLEQIEEKLKASATSTVDGRTSRFGHWFKR